MNRFKIVGTKYCGTEAHAICQNLKPGAALVLVREPDNRVDRRAVRVEHMGTKIGYIPADHNREISRAMDDRKIDRLPAVAGLGKAGPTVEVEPPT